MNEHATMEKVVNLCKRRGFIFPSSEIYGGIGSTWDYGPVGVELKRNVKEAWWKAVVTGPQRHRRPGRLDPDAPEGVGGFGPRRRVFGSAGGVQGLPSPFPGRPCGGAGVPGLWRRAHRGAAVQPHVQDLHGTGGGHRQHGVPAAGNRPGHLRQLQQRPRYRAPEAPLRHRADRQELPERDHPRQLHLPHPRVRADGDRVLRQARRG